MSRGPFSASDYFQVSNIHGVTTYPVSMACWFYRNLETGQGCPIAFGFSGNHWLRILTHPNTLSNQITADSRAGAAGTGNSAFSGGGFTVGEWHHACAVFVSSTERRIFLDGVRATNSGTTAFPSLSFTCLGHNRDGFDPVNGFVAEGAYWDAVLDDSDVLVLSGGGSPLDVKAGNLLAYYPMDETGGDAIDALGNTDVTMIGTVGTGPRPPLTPAPVSSGMAIIRQQYERHL